MASFYKHSGKVPPKSIAIALITSVVLIPFFSWLYVYGDIHIPIIFLNVILVLIYAIFNSVGIGVALKEGKMRNVPVAMGIAVFVGIFSLYVQWVMYCSFMLHSGHTLATVDADLPGEGFSSQKFSYFFLHPAEMFRFMLDISKNGTWGIGRFLSSSGQENVHGPMLWLAWAGEAAAIVYIPVWMVRRQLHVPFSEHKNEWMDKTSVTKNRVYYAGPLAEMKAALTQHNFSLLLQLPPDNTGGTNDFTKAELFSSGHPDENYLTVSLMKHGNSRRRKSKPRAKVIIRNMIISQAEMDYLKNALAQ